MTTEDFDKRFDDGEDIFSLMGVTNLDALAVTFPVKEAMEAAGIKRISIDIPLMMFNAIEREAKRENKSPETVISEKIADLAKHVS